MAQDKKNMGRPPKEGGYTKSVNLRLTEEQYAKLQAMARRLRMKTGENIIEIDVLREYINGLPDEGEEGIKAA